MEECPVFQPEYSSCEKTGGSLPQFFETVAIETMLDGFTFTTPNEQGVQVTEYIPDRVFRLGSDYHVTETGDFLPDLPSLETSFCEEGVMIRREFTVLPDDTLASERLTMNVDEDGTLLFEIQVGGELLLSASCFE